MFSHRVHPVRITTAVEEKLVLAREDREIASWYISNVYETPEVSEHAEVCLHRGLHPPLGEPLGTY